MSCAPRATERIIQGVVAVLVLAFALDAAPDLGIAIIGSAAAVVLAVGAVRGWCPGSLLRRIALRSADGDSSR